MPDRYRFRAFTFRLSSLFLVTTVVAFGTFFYGRARTMERTCSLLHDLKCPAVYSDSLQQSEYEDYCFLSCSVGGLPRNEIRWRGFMPAVSGAWELERFTVFLNPSAIHPLYKNEMRIHRLLVELPNLDTIVICAGENPEILSVPCVKEFLERLLLERPGIRIVTQQFVQVG